MIIVQNIQEDNLEKVREFLKNVQAIKEIDEEILLNTSVLLDEGQIVGTISYEKFNEYGLIRYFIFKKYITLDVIKELFNNLAKSASYNEINYIFSIINNAEIENLFLDLHFEIIDKENLYIDEELFNITKYKEAKVMMRELKDFDFLEN